ncbi:MAG: radical SAM protein [Bdellovibrionales bacterium]|jgi:wyosine [tRNA(Phe)-imidazoG37] synthetase (radical SAM superfamily)|nr:radical SAM protein [Bdellovibrionales bacterium]
MNKTEHNFQNESSIYGPIKSWRLGQSLGVDPLFKTSICSFNCIYCQLGNIVNHTNERKVYISTEKVIEDLHKALSNCGKIDHVTFSGNGEPTLALNLGEISRQIKEIIPHAPQAILTNATTFDDSMILEDIKTFDNIIVKLDASSEDMFQKINRPVQGITLEKIVSNIKQLKSTFDGKIDVQVMFLPLNNEGIDELAKLLIEISPNSVQLNTPKRSYPLSWHRENRGNHNEIFDYQVRELSTISKDDAYIIESKLKKLTNLKIRSIY